jgi:hypothetical protein
MYASFPCDKASNKVETQSLALVISKQLCKEPTYSKRTWLRVEIRMLSSVWVCMYNAESIIHKGLFGKWRIQVDGKGLKGILRNFDL